MNEVDYFSVEALSNSGMKDLDVSPLRFWHKHINPDRKIDDAATKAMTLGSALHCAVLEPGEFGKRYASDLDVSQFEVCLDTIGDIREWITSKGERPKGTKKFQIIDQALSIMEAIGERVPILLHEEDRHAAENAGKTIISIDDFRRVSAMADSLQSEPALAAILSEGNPEVPVFTTDPDTGVPLKAKFDWLGLNITADLKTFSQKRGTSIEKSVCDAIYYENYYRQAYFYQYVRSLSGFGPSPFVFVFVESEEPYEVRIKSLSEGNTYWEMAKHSTHSLIRFYADLRDQYGTAPWRSAQRVEPLTDLDMRQLAF